MLLLIKIQTVKKEVKLEVRSTGDRQNSVAQSKHQEMRRSKLIQLNCLIIEANEVQ